MVSDSKQNPSGVIDSIAKSQSLHETIEHSVNLQAVDVSEGLIEWLTLSTYYDQDRYQELSLLGKGGMSVVHKVFDRKVGREVALKRLDKTDDGTYLSFLLEARVMSRLNHPNILPVYDLLTAKRPLSYDRLIGYTMQIALHSSLKEQMVIRGFIDLHELCQIMIQVALAVDHAHSLGILHRDIKPQNILIGGTGEVYLTDWGVCTLLSHHSYYESLQQLRKDTLVGTPCFMAPEQASSDPSSSLSVRTDIYGLGATLYYMLTGTAPIKGDDLSEVLKRCSEGVISSPSEVWASRSKASPYPKHLEEICLKALSLDPNLRFQSARAFAEALQIFSTGQLELERSRKAAEQSYASGLKVLSRFEELFNQRSHLKNTIAALHQQYKRQRSDETRQALWSAEDDYDALGRAQEETFSSVVSAFLRAISENPQHKTSRSALFQLYLTRYEQALEERDTSMALFFEERLREYGNDEELKGFDHPSLLILHQLPAQTSVKVFFNPIKRRQGTLKELLTIPIYKGEEIELPRGNFLIELSAPEGVLVKLPLQLRSTQTMNLSSPIPRMGAVPEGFVYIGDKKAISEYPTTVGEYYRFLNHPSTLGGEQRAPRYHQTYYAERAESGLFETPYTDIEGDTWLASWPVLLVNHLDAVAYCQWLSTQLDRSCRLPSVEEWHYSASGGDQRHYPWGDSFDPSLCVMRESHQGRPTPVPVGSASADRSPLGVADLAGGICQWTSSPVPEMSEHYRVVGAGYSSFEALCRLDQELIGHREETFSHVGFRPILELNYSDFLPEA